MRHVFLVLSLVVLGSMTSGCASECEKQCDKAFSDAKAAAGGNWGVLKDAAKAGLKMCKSQCG